MKLFFTILVLTCLCHYPSFATVDDEKSIIDYKIGVINENFEKIGSTSDDFTKKRYNNKIVNYFEKILDFGSSFTYDFENLNQILVLTASDNKLRVYTWNVSFSDGTHKYYGFLQYKESRSADPKIFQLNDLSEFYDDEDRSFSSHREWYGSLYYEIITTTWNRNTYYTLLGWDGGDFLLNRKVVEVLEFSRRGLPQFGNRMIVLERDRVDRLVFEFSSRAAMLLRYNESQNLIIMDHLSPPEPRFKGQRQFYGPDLSYDALEFVAGRWHLKSDIDPDIAINYQRNRRTEAMRRQREARINR